MFSKASYSIIKSSTTSNRESGEGYVPANVFMFTHTYNFSKFEVLSVVLD